MSQQEFEYLGPRPDEELYQVQYPDAWSNQGQQTQQNQQAQQEETPGDKLQFTYDQPNYQSSAQSQTQVPWWARPQPQRNGSHALAGLIVFLILAFLFMGGLGAAGTMIGSHAHLFDLFIGAVRLLLVFFFLFVFFFLSIIGFILKRVFGHSWRNDRRAWRDYWRTNRRAWRDFRGGW
jgi:hypothetical protein